MFWRWELLRQQSLTAPIRKGSVTSSVSFCVLVLTLFSCTAMGDEGRLTNWRRTLPKDVQESILWFADHEEGNLEDWEPSGVKDPGGGVLNTGGREAWAKAVSAQAHSGDFSAEASIQGAVRGIDGSRAVRLMRWTNRPWDIGGEHFPLEAYYSTWVFIPRAYNSKKYPPWDPGDGGWWNIFQFKADDDDGVSQPIWALNVFFDDASNEMYCGLYSPVNRPSSVSQRRRLALPVGKWVHLEAFYRVSHKRMGEVVVWQDGRKILHAPNVRTAASKSHLNAVWGIGNYTDHIAGGSREGESTIYFDDAAVSMKRISASFTK